MSIDVRRGLIALRGRYGAESAIGRRCSNIIEMLEAYPPEWIDYLEPDYVKEQRAALQKQIAISSDELSKLTAA